MNKPLVHSKLGVGKKAQEIYLEGCALFGWDKKLASNFGNLASLYAETRDNKNKVYGIWFIQHSNLTGTEKSGWKNIINIWNGEITQSAQNLVSQYSNGDKRIIFARDSFNEYIFMGVYEQILINKIPNTEVFKRISTIYQ